MDTLERFLSFAPLTDEQLIIVADMVANEFNSLANCPNHPDEIENYLTELNEYWDSICARLASRHPHETDYLSDNLVCLVG